MLSLTDILKQEKELQFDSFNEDTAWDLGSAAVQLAKERNLAVAIRIDRKDQILFQAAREGTTVDNDLWLQGKSKVVHHFHHSSFYISRKLIEGDHTMEEKYLLSSTEYRAKGGGFPLRLKNASVIGAIIISGLTDHEDHALVVEILQNYLSSRGIS